MSEQDNHKIQTCGKEGLFHNKQTDGTQGVIQSVKCLQQLQLLQQARNEQTKTKNKPSF